MKKENLKKKIKRFEAVKEHQIKDNLPEHAKQTNKVLEALKNHLK